MVSKGTTLLLSRLFTVYRISHFRLVIHISGKQKMLWFMLVTTATEDKLVGLDDFWHRAVSFQRIYSQENVVVSAQQKCCVCSGRRLLWICSLHLHQMWLCFHLHLLWRSYWTCFRGRYRITTILWFDFATSKAAFFNSFVNFRSQVNLLRQTGQQTKDSVAHKWSWCER